MSRLHIHPENHNVDRIGWPRAAALGANDGIVSTASLIVGVAAAKPIDILLSGVAGLVAGAMSMAAGEYVSVSYQSDTEYADLTGETKELADAPEFESEELAQIFVKRGLGHEQAIKAADQLMAKDAFAAHARDELGISEITTARPVQAALTSARLQLVPRCPSLWWLCPRRACSSRLSRSPRWASSRCWARSERRPVAPTR